VCRCKGAKRVAWRFKDVLSVLSEKPSRAKEGKRRRKRKIVVTHFSKKKVNTQSTSVAEKCRCRLHRKKGGLHRSGEGGPLGGGGEGTVGSGKPRVWRSPVEKKKKEKKGRGDKHVKKKGKRDLRETAPAAFGSGGGRKKITFRKRWERCLGGERPRGKIDASLAHSPPLSAKKKGPRMLIEKAPLGRKKGRRKGEMYRKAPSGWSSEDRKRSCVKRRAWLGRKKKNTH